MKILLATILLVACIACNNRGGSNADEQNTNKPGSEQPGKTESTSGNSSLTVDFNGYNFIARHEVVAVPMPENNTLLIGGEDENYVMSIEIPAAKSEGSFVAKGEIVEKSTKKAVFSSDDGTLTVTIETKTKDHITGTFTFVKGHEDGSAIATHRGKFRASFFMI